MEQAIQGCDVLQVINSAVWRSVRFQAAVAAKLMPTAAPRYLVHAPNQTSNRRSAATCVPTLPDHVSTEPRCVLCFNCVDIISTRSSVSIHIVQCSPSIRLCPNAACVLELNPIPSGHKNHVKFDL